MHIRYLGEIQAVSSAFCEASGACGRKLRRLIGAFLFAIACCTLVLPAQVQTGGAIQGSLSPTLSSNQVRAEKYSVSGTVINAATGEPIRKALVQLYGAQQRTSFTDGDGHFQFEGIPAGQVSFNAQKPGYFGEQEMGRQAKPPTEVGPKTDSVVLKLTPEGVITGKVTTATGIPLEHVPLSLTYLNVRDGRKHWESKGISVTTEDGRYRIANLLPGTYYLAAGPFTPLVESVFDLPPEPKVGYPGVYYPGVPDLASASPISLSAGQQAEANFTLNEVPSYDISGTISGYIPNQGVSLQLCDQSGNPLPFSLQFSPDNSRFDFHRVPAGVYVLKAFSQAAPRQPIRATSSLNVASNIFNLHLTLTPAISIPISVRTESVAQSASGAMKQAPVPSQGPPLGVRLLASQPGASDAYASLEGPPGRQTLMLGNVEPGRYSVELMPQGGWYVQSAEYGQTNLLTDDMTVIADAPPLAIQVALRNDTASLTGTVSPRDGVDLPATVVAIPERLPKATPKMGYYYPPKDKSPESATFFVIDSLAPGDYLVFAFDHAESLEYANPDALQNYVSQATHVTLAPGQQAHVTLDLIRTEGASE